MFENRYFDFPKPSSLLKELVTQTTSGHVDCVILDFFAGSGTTAQAVMELNEADGGNRRYICVQLPEKTEEQSEAAKAGYATIADITAARIKKVIEKIEAARAEKTDLLNENKSLPKLGFRKFTLAPSNFKLWRGDVIETIADEGVGVIRAFQDRRQRERTVEIHRHILQRMHRAVRVATQHRQLQLLQEQALAADRRQRAVEHFVTARAHGHQLDDQARVRGAQAIGDVFALPEGERALAGGDAQRGHAGIIPHATTTAQVRAP